MLMAALALGLGAWPMSSRGDGLTSNSNSSNTATESLEFTLNATQAIVANAGSPPAPGSTATTPPQVALEVSPVSVVQPPNPSVAALQILSDSTGYYNNNASQLSVETINSPSDGSPVTTQLLGLGFYGQGLPAGASLTFSLPFAQSVVGNPASNFMPFTALDPSSGNTISSLNSTTGVLTAPGYTLQYDGLVSTGTVTAQETPEPLSLLVWSILAGLGLWRVRSHGPYGPRGSLVAGK
jgi:hypothetical protein